MHIVKFLKRAFLGLALAFVGGLAVAADTWPDKGEGINDFDPTVGVGNYIEYIASNTVGQIVVLSNNILTVNGEVVDLTTPAALKDYALVSNITSIVTNNYPSGRVVQTNWTTVAYMDSILPDGVKADKVIELHDFYCPTVGVVLKMAQSMRAPFASWQWDSTTPANGYSAIDLFFTNGVWRCATNGQYQATLGPIEDKDGEQATMLDFGNGMRFVSTNYAGHAYVVYTDTLKETKEEIKNYISGTYVARTNLFGLSKQISEDKLYTIRDIADILRGIRSELTSLTGTSTMEFYFSTSSSNHVINLRNVETVFPGDTVEVDWGDGSGIEVTTLPAAHTNLVSGPIVVKVTGFIKSISGTSSYSFATVANNNTQLTNVVIGAGVGLETVGGYAFRGCTGIMSLRFLPSSVSSFGTYAFSNTGIASLDGMPTAVSAIPTRCFYYCSSLSSLEGMPANVTNIGSYAFASTHLTSLQGMSDNVLSLGAYAFHACSQLKSIRALENTSLNEIPSYCFTATAIGSLEGIPNTVETIKTYAFQNCPSLASLSGLPNSLKQIGTYVFAGCSKLTDGMSLATTSVTNIGSYCFSGCTNLNAIVFPSTLEYMGANALTNCGTANSSTPKIGIGFQGKTTAEIKNMANFPWGLSAAEGSTIIIGLDGSIVGDGNGGWTVNSEVTEARLSSVASGANVALGTITPLSSRSIQTTIEEFVRGGNAFLVDWGDGERTTQTTHTYEEAKEDVPIRIFGRLDALGGKDGLPLISVNGSAAPIQSVSIGNSVGLRAFGVDTFRGCSLLTGITGLTDNFTSLGSDCFNGASAISSITSVLDGAGNIDELPKGCFANCSELLSLDGIPSQIDTLGEGCFSNCSSLVSIDALANTSTTVIPSNCFAECSSIEELTEGIANVSEIQGGAFSQCSKVAVLDIGDSLKTVGVNAFYNLGQSVEPKFTEDNLEYTLRIDSLTRGCEDVAALLGLKDGSVEDATSGIQQPQTMIFCRDADLAYNNTLGNNRWEILASVIRLELEIPEDAASRTFVVNEPILYTDSSYIWNWGDGTIDKWVSSGNLEHTYPEPGNYTISVKGMIGSLQGQGGANDGPFLRLAGTAENPYLVGYKIESDSPLEYVGRYAFTHCPNLRSIDELPSEATRGIKKKGLSVRSATTDRLETLLSRFHDRGYVKYGTGAFEESGLKSIANLPPDTAYLTNRLFAANRSLTSLEGLPDKVVDVYDECFRDCTGLTSLYGLPLSLGYLSEGCFSGCNALTSLYGLESNTNLVTFEPYVFSRCWSMERLDGMPMSVTQIGAGAFQGSGLSYLYGMSPNVTYIGDAAFSDCPFLSATSGLSPSLTSLGRMAFTRCTSLESVPSLPAGLSKIEDYTFLGCSNLTSAVISNTVESMGQSVFVGSGDAVVPAMDLDGNDISTELRFPDRTCAQIRTLYGLDNFNVTLPYTKLIGWNGYIVYKDSEWQDRIDTIEIQVTTTSPNTDVWLGKNFVRSGYNVTLNWGDNRQETPIIELIDTTSSETPTQTNGLVSTSSVLGYRYASPGTYTISLVGRFEEIGSIDSLHPFVYSTDDTVQFTVDRFDIGNNVGLHKLGDSCFRGYSNITSLYDMVESEIAYIGTNCFEGCSNLLLLAGYPKQAKRVDSGAFKNCASLRDISAMEEANVLSLGEGAFENCSSLISLQGLGSSLTAIPDNCFKGCSSLESLRSIPQYVAEIGKEAFRGCSSLTSLTGMPSAVGFLGDGCFRGCSSLASYHGMSSNLAALPDRCFQGCSSLTSLSGIPKMAAWGDYCFADCTILNNLNDFPSFTSIGAGMFQNCKAITSLDWIPSSVAVLSNGCFKGCSGIRGISPLPTSITRLYAEALADCTMLTNIEFRTDIPTNNIGANAIANIGKDAEYWVDEDGWRGKAVVRFPTKTTAQIMAMENFPWSVPEKTTKFVGKDGFIVCIDGEWTVYQPVIEMSMQVTEGQKYILNNNVSCTTNSAVLISWGDGSLIEEIPVADYGVGQSPRYRVESTNHTYATSGSVMVRMYGPVSMIRGVGTQPFMYLDDTLYKNRNPSVKSIRIPFSSPVTNVAGYAFANFSGMTNVVVEADNLMDIGAGTFYQNSSLKSVSLDSPLLRSFGQSAFEKSGIDSILWLPSGIEAIGNRCFADCDSLVSFGKELGNVTSIGEQCFSGCDMLGSGGTTITWPTNVSAVAAGMFSDCPRLASVRFRNSKTTLGGNCLYNVGGRADAVTDEDNASYRTFVDATVWTVDDFWATNSFTTAGSTIVKSDAAIKFLCADGYIARLKGKDAYNRDVWNWGKVYYGLSMRFDNIAANNTITIGTTTKTANLVWVFSDGTVVTQTTGSVSHTFAGSMAVATVSLATKDSATSISGSSTTSWISGTAKSKLSQLIVTPSSGISSIGQYAFNGCSGLQQIRIASPSITTIGNYAFQNCSNLRSIEIECPNLTTIGTSAFKGCSYLPQINLVGTKLSSLGGEAFSGCTRIRSITLPKTIATIDATIGGSAFTSIGTSLSSLTDEFGNAYKSEIWFGGYDLTAGSEQPRIAELTCAEILSLSGIGWGATNVLFQAVDGLVKQENSAWIAKEYSITLTSNSAFLETGSVNYGSTVSIYIPSGDFAVDWGDGTRTSKVTLHGYLANKNISRIVVRGRLNSIAGHRKHYNYQQDTPFVKIAAGTGGLTGTFGVKLGNSCGVTTIGDYAFINTGISSLTGDGLAGVTGIGSWAFHNAYGLSSIAALGNVTAVGTSAFEGCSSLVSTPSLPLCRTMAARTFFGCSNLTTANSLGSITNIPSQCFQNCANLTSITIPSAVTVIGSSAFEACTNLTSTNILQNEITTIEDRAFFGCGIAKTAGLPMPSNLQKLGSYVMGLENTGGAQNGKYYLSSKPSSIFATSFTGGGTWFINTFESIPQYQDAVWYGNSNYFGRVVTCDTVWKAGHVEPQYSAQTRRSEAEYIPTPSGFAITVVLSQNETVTLRNITGSDMLINWGDGQWEPNVASFPSGSKTHTYSQGGEVTINISGDVTQIGGGGTAFCTVSGSGYVSGIVVRNPSILTVGANAFLDMTNCSQIVFKDGVNAANCNIANANAFSGLGSSLPNSTISGTTYKTLVEFEMWTSDTAKNKNLPLSGTTLFGTQDGYVKNGNYLFSGIEYTASFTDKKKITTRTNWYWSFTGVNLYTYNGVKYYPNEKYILSGPSGWHPPDITGVPFGNVLGRVFSESEYYISIHSALFGPFYFKDNRTGYITIRSDNHSEDGVLYSGLGYDLGVRTAEDETDNRTPTIRVTGRLIGVESLIQQTPDPDFPSPRITNLKFGIACQLSSIGSFSNVSSSRTRENGQMRRDDALIPIEPPESDYVWLPDTIEFFGKECFAGNDEITDLSWIPSHLTNVSAKCFADCPNLVSISGLTNAVGLVDIGECAFANCYGITGTNVLPNSVASLGKMMFQNIGQKAENTIVVDFGSKNTADIRSMLAAINFEIDNRIHTYNPSSGARSKIVLKGSDGYLVDTCGYDEATKEYYSTYVESDVIPD